MRRPRMLGKTILHVITGLRSGGAERMLVRLVFATRAHGTERQLVVSLLDDGEYVEDLRQEGIELHCLGLSKLWHLPAAFIRLVGLMRRVKPDIVMTWLYHADFLGTLAAVASGLGVHRVVWNLRCSNLNATKYALTTRLLLKLLPWMSTWPAIVATNSRSGQLAHEAQGYRPRRWALLPNGVDLNEFCPGARDRAQVRAEWHLPKTAQAIGLIARVDPQKDHQTFLAAAKTVAARNLNARFILMGRGTQGLTVPDYVFALGPRRDVPRLMRALDIVVVCSAYGEGFPNALLEAMATGLCCIVTDVGDAAAICEDTAIVIAPRRPECLAKAIESLLSEDAQARVLRGRRARHLVRRKYDLQNMLKNYRDLWTLV